MSKDFTKRDLILKICRSLKDNKKKDKMFTQEDITDIIQKALDYLNEALSEGRTVEIRNFGVFEVRVSKPRVGRNPNTPDVNIVIPSRPVIRFKPGKEMRDLVQKIDIKKLSKK